MPRPRGYGGIIVGDYLVTYQIVDASLPDLRPARSACSAALPPTAILFPPNSTLRMARSDADTLLTSAELTTILDRPTTMIGRGQIAPGEVDRRMQSLDVSLEVFQVTDRNGVLISLGVVTPHRGASSPGGATTTDLWSLACETLPLHGVASRYPRRIGDDALLVAYGGITAQVAWLAGDRLTTASVTCLDGDDGWVVEAASAIAQALDRRRG